jgi:uncharacterized protein GlcG (DUF336 family)
MAPERRLGYSTLTIKIFIMKKMFLLMALVITSIIYPEVQAETKINKEAMKNGEQIFLKHADECLAIIEQAAQKLSITGAAMVAFIPGDVSESWISKMKVMGRLADNEANFLAIAYAKAAEMAVTRKNSGNEGRKDITGEFGWQGGVIIKVGSGYLVGAFSGGTGQQDADVAKEGLDWLSKKYE